MQPMAREFDYRLVELNAGGAVGEAVFYNRSLDPQAEIGWSVHIPGIGPNWRDVPERHQDAADRDQLRQWE